MTQGGYASRCHVVCVLQIAAEAHPRVDTEPFGKTPGAAGVQLAEFVGVVPPAFGLGAILLDHRRLAPGALFHLPDDPQQVRTFPAVRTPAYEQDRAAHNPCLEHAAVLSVAAAAITALRYLPAPCHPHGTQSTKGEADRQIEGESPPERVRARRRR